MDTTPDAVARDSRRAAGGGSDDRSPLRRWIEDGPHGLLALGAASFLESTLVPIPLKAVLIPFLLARSDRVWRLATVVLIGCVRGALVGYGLGRGLMETVGASLVETMGWSDGLERFRSTLDERGFVAILLVGVTPIPLFVLATLVARGIRYYGLALLVRLLGDRAQTVWERHATKISVGILLLAGEGIRGPVRQAKLASSSQMQGADHVKSRQRM